MSVGAQRGLEPEGSDLMDRLTVEESHKAVLL